MDVNPLGTLGLQMANQQIQVEGQMAVSLVAQAKATGDAAQAQAQQNAPSSKVAPPPPGQGTQVDVSA